jgi:hypothetical protein
MLSKPIVHVVTRVRSGLTQALRMALEPGASVRPWEGIPRLSDVAATDIVVADLTDFPCAVDQERLRGLLDCADLWLVVEAGVPSSEFLAVLARASANIVKCTALERREGFLRLTNLLNSKLEGPSADHIVDLVLSKEPFLRPAEQLVTAVCRWPHDIRHPRDLATACGLRLTDVKQRVSALGFTRVEHFIVAVRSVSYEQLVAQRRVPIQVARRLTGITDPSNHRRELARAVLHSPSALRHLA